MISTEDGLSNAVQGKDLSAVVGQTVNLTGTLAEGSSAKTIMVIMVDEIKK